MTIFLDQLTSGIVDTDQRIWFTPVLLNRRELVGLVQGGNTAYSVADPKKLTEYETRQFRDLSAIFRQNFNLVARVGFKRNDKYILLPQEIATERYIYLEIKKVGWLFSW